MTFLDTLADQAGANNGKPRSQWVRVDHLLALNRASIAIMGELDLDSLLQRIVDVARELVGCGYSALGVLGDDGYIARFPTSGISETEREQIGALPRGHGLLGVMLHAGQTMRVRDIGKDSRRVGFPPHHPPMTSLLGVPIFVRGELVGDLYLTDKQGGPEFSEEDEWTVQLLATHAEIALTNAELHAEKVQALALTRRAQARSDALSKVSHAINSSVHLDEVISLIVQSAADLLDASGAAVHLLEPVAPESIPGSLLGSTLGSRFEGKVSNPPEAASESGQRTPAGRQPLVLTQEMCFVARYAIGLEQLYTDEAEQLPMDRSVAGRAVTSRLTQVVGDASLEPDLVFPRLAAKTLCSLTAVPLIVGHSYPQGREIVGVLSAYSDRTHAFDPEAVRLLEAFGAIAGTALYNAGIYEEAKRGREAAEYEQEQLRELEQMKDEFLSTAAHELRTPLTTILLSAGLALEQLERLADADGIDPRIVDLVALVVEGSERMQSLVNDLLDLTRLEQGRTVFTFEALDLREVVSASVEAVAPLFESGHQQLNVRLPEFRCLVLGDRPRLEQVVINLLSNANKYSPPGSRLEIRIQQKPEECLVAVRDAGPGVPEEERERIFERFYRSSLHRNDRTSSTGLGLPIARKIAEMHRGRIWAEAAPGGGSIFTLALPGA